MTGTPGVSNNAASATSLVAKSSATTTSAVIQKRRRSAALAILFLLLAGDAQAGVGQRVEPLEPDLLAAVVAVAELVGAAVQPPERLVHMPEIPPLLRGEEKLLLALHGVGALVGHVEGVGGQIAVGGLERAVEGLVVIPELLHHARPLFDQTLLQMGQLLLVHATSVVKVPPPWPDSSERRTPTTTARLSISNCCCVSGVGARRPISSRRARVSCRIASACARTASSAARSPSIHRFMRVVYSYPASRRSRWIRLTTSRARPSR